MPGSRVDLTARALAATLAVLFALVAIDSGRVPYTTDELWFAVYAPGVVAMAVWAVTVRLTALQVATVSLALPGFGRAVLYAIGPEHRITPIGLNGALAILLYLHHRSVRFGAR